MEAGGSHMSIKLKLNTVDAPAIVANCLSLAVTVTTYEPANKSSPLVIENVYVADVNVIIPLRPVGTVAYS